MRGGKGVSRGSAIYFLQGGSDPLRGAFLDGGGGAGVFFLLGGASSPRDE